MSSIFKPVELAIRRAILGMLAKQSRPARVGGAIALPEAPTILFLRQDRLGDALITTPLLLAVKARYPQAQIVMLLGKNNRAMAPLLPVECESVVYRKSLLKDIAMLRRLRRRRVDLLIDLTDNASVTSSFLIAGIKPKLALGIEKENRVVYDVLVPKLSPQQYHISERIAQLLGPLGIDPKSVDLRPRIRLDTLPLREKLVALNISAGSEARRPPMETIASAARQIAEMGYDVAIFSEPKESEIVSKIVAEASHPRVSAAPAETSYAAFARRLSACTYLITPDTSVVHLGAALGKPMVVLFAPIQNGYVQWTPVRVPYRSIVKSPSLAALEPTDITELFSSLIASTALPLANPAK